MADHIRKQIRDGVVTDVTGLATTADNVFRGRARPREESDLPCLLVHAGDEENERLSMGAWALGRQNTVHVVALVEGTDETVDDALDAIGVEVEGALGGNTLGGLISRSVMATVRRDYDGKGEKVVASLDMEWVMLAVTPENDPTTSNLG